MLTVFQPSIWRAAAPQRAEPRQPEPVQSIAINCNPGAAEPAAQAVAAAEVEATPETKRCDTCKKTKPLDQFSRRGSVGKKKGLYDGRYASCQPCRSAMLSRAQHKALAVRQQETAEAEAEQIRIALQMEIGIAKAMRDAQMLAEAEAKARAEEQRTQRDSFPITQYTSSGWPVDRFAESAQKIRKNRYLGSRELQVAMA
jgi:hypothetical protein